jgi:hypothetical protein
MTIEYLRKEGLIILECISGSKAYGLDTPASDTDIKGVFILPKQQYYGIKYVEQINNETNDIVFYELGRFMELLSFNNPNILELLNTPENAIIYKHPFLEEIKTEKIISKLCKDTFGKFAFSQIKKAKGLKKKILNPIKKERNNILSYCFVNHGQGAIPLLIFLDLKGWKQQHCGLINIPHMKDLYGLFYNENAEFNGIIRHEDANDVCLSSIPRESEQETLLYFNRDGYSTYCKEYKEYWQWVGKRNVERYKNTQDHGKNYDAKNMMHVFRLLDMACEIGRESKIIVKRPNREFLLEIKSGKYEYEELLKMSDKLRIEMEEAFTISSLPETPDLIYINDLTFTLREKFYNEKNTNLF